ncbi:MAG: hypothetical protein AAGD07_17305 [Planctomycetota bacterium]
MMSFVAIAFGLAHGGSNANETTTDFGPFHNCPVLDNGVVRVVLCPSLGGRILEYSLAGKNALWVSEFESSNKPLPRRRDGTAKFPFGGPSAGRFDVGPEHVTPKRPLLFLGEWTSERMSDLHVRLTSQACPNSDMRLRRDVVLDTDSTRLKVTQHIENVGSEAIRRCHWSRTFANSSGVTVIPLSGSSSLPNQYMRYQDGGLVIWPEDENLAIRDGFAILRAPARTTKYGFDSEEGWLAHLQETGLVYVKQFPVAPERAYGELSSFTLATWTPESGDKVELEPIGPLEWIAPGESASFTETWWVFDSAELTSDAVAGGLVKLNALRKRVFELPDFEVTPSL